MRIVDQLLRQNQAFEQHPLTADHVLVAWGRFVRHQLKLRVRGKYELEWIGPTKLTMRPHATGLSGNAYFGLHEYREMSFLLDLLGQNDTFLDGGANAGSYTVLAAGACRSRVVAVEPSPDSLPALLENIRLNSLEDLVSVWTCALSGERGVANFSIGLDTTNHLVGGENGLVVATNTIDAVVASSVPTLIKLDLEGGEPGALEGATQTLSDPALLAAIIEDRSDAVLARMADASFKEFAYEPTDKRLSPGRNQGNNSIWVRNDSLAEVTARLSSDLAGGFGQGASSTPSNS